MKDKKKPFERIKQSNGSPNNNQKQSYNNIPNSESLGREILADYLSGIALYHKEELRYREIEAFYFNKVIEMRNEAYWENQRAEICTENSCEYLKEALIASIKGNDASLISIYINASNFFKRMEKHYKNNEIFCLKEMDAFNNKALKNQKRADICADNYSGYLKLTAICYLKMVGCLND